MEQFTSTRTRYTNAVNVAIKCSETEEKELCLERMAAFQTRHSSQLLSRLRECFCQQSNNQLLLDHTLQLMLQAPPHPLGASNVTGKTATPILLAH